VLKTEGYIRGYTTVEHKDGRSEFEIELKYFDGAPVIRENRAHFQAGPPRLRLGEDAAARQQRSRHRDHIDAEGVMATTTRATETSAAKSSAPVF
jgi:hypothetical protein